jgi:hypothetical protein
MAAEVEAENELVGQRGTSASEQATGTARGTSARRTTMERASRETDRGT